MFASDFYGERRPSEREHRIIALLAQGLSNKDIARQMGTTEHVVKNRVRTIYDKLGVWNRVELALWYEAKGDNERGSTLEPSPERGHLASRLGDDKYQVQDYSGTWVFLTRAH